MLKPLKLASVLCALSVPVLLMQQRPVPAANEQASAAGAETDDAPAIPEKEKPFWDAAQAFVDAYSKRDAKAIGDLFTTDAEFYDEFGELTVGRDAITQLFQQVFEATPDALVEEIDIERIRYISTIVALEEGRVSTSEYPGGPRNISRYVALHLKGRDGVWRINTLKNLSREKGTASEHLAELSWLVGEWVSEDSASIVETTCDWSDDGNYLLRHFTVQSAEGNVMDGVQRIGWDTVRKEIRSWTFDSAGGYVEGTWKRNGDQWLVTSNGYNAVGDAASGVAVYTVHDAERITWQYRNLVVGNELRGDVEPIVMVRRPPSPETTE